jgi:hypothetical protein
MVETSSVQLEGRSTMRMSGAVLIRRRLGWPGILAAACVASAFASPATMAAQPTKGAKYEYQSGSNVSAASFRVSHQGHSLSDVMVTLSTPCSNGREGVGVFFGFLQAPPARLQIAPDGSFSGTFSAGEDWLDPFTASEQYSLSGRFIRHGKAARLVVRAQAVGEGGTTCDSGDHRHTAKRVAR